MIEYFVRQGIQVFAISWRNPTAEQRNWGFDTYGQAILTHSTPSRRSPSLIARICRHPVPGGILAAMTAAHLDATGRGPSGSPG